MYYLALNRVKQDADSDKLAMAVPEHIGWIARQLENGTIVLAGRWGEAGGMAIIRAGSEAEAQGLLDEDPLTRSGQITLELERFFPDAPVVARFD